MHMLLTDLRRRLRALLLAAVILWAICVTAGSDTAGAAGAALRAAVPIHTLRWELGDLWQADDLSAAAAMAIQESPLLAAARPAVAELLRQTETPDVPDLTEPAVVPVEETPLDAVAAADNGVSAKTLVPTDPSGYVVMGRTYISNATDHDLSVQALQQVFDAELTAEGPHILIIHSHGSEAYTPADGTEPVWSGDHRTTDSRYNVVKVGDVMADAFAAAGISVLHDRTLYDYPSYTGAYDRSLAAIESYLVQYPSIRFILDIHRDAIEDSEGNQYKVITAIGESSAAQITLVVGSDGSGLAHPDWMENLRLAAAIQEQALGEYPTLMRPILLRNSRYNQHATTGSLLVEIGAAGNSPEEAALAGRLFAEQMVEVLQARSK